MIRQLILFLTIFPIALIFNNIISDRYSNYAAAQGEPTIKDPSLKVDVLTQGLSLPTSMAFIDNNNILVLEKETGNVRLISNGVLQPNPVLKVTVNFVNERGLLGIATTNDSPKK